MALPVNTSTVPEEPSVEFPVDILMLPLSSLWDAPVVMLIPPDMSVWFCCSVVALPVMILISPVLPSLEASAVVRRMSPLEALFPLPLERRMDPPWELVPSASPALTRTSPANEFGCSVLPDDSERLLPGALYEVPTDTSILPPVPVIELPL